MNDLANKMEHPFNHIFLTAEQLEQRVAELGDAISTDYASLVTVDSPLILIGVLKGVIPFFADLMRVIRVPIQIHFLDLNAYTNETREEQNMELHTNISQAIKGHHVLFVEDIIDAGLTLNHLTRVLYLHDPASLQICTMFDKQQRRIIDTEIKYVGFELYNEYLVGYGLDQDELYRNLPFVAQANRD